MIQALKTDHLTPRRFEQAWPLIREIASDVSLESWCAFAEAISFAPERETRRQGILVTERKRTIRGLVTYEAIRDLSHGWVLLLRNAVVLDLALREPIALALHHGSVDVAEAAECDGLCLELTPQMAWIGDVWLEHANDEASMPLSVVNAPDQPPRPISETVVSVVGC